MDGEFVEKLRELMRQWHYPEPRIEEILPKFLEVCLEVGIVAWRDGELVGTDLIDDEEAWDRIWAELERKGIGENFAL